MCKPASRASSRKLDDKGRYSVRVDVGNPIDGYETYTPKYFPCATTECVRSGQNLDMSDPETRAYVKALDKKILDDIGKASTVAMVVSPAGVVGGVAQVVGPVTSIASGMLEDQTLKSLLKEGLQAVAGRYLQTVYGFSETIANRVVSIVDLGGGWQAFMDRAENSLNKQKK